VGLPRHGGSPYAAPVHAVGRKIELYGEELLLALDEGLLSHEEAAALREDALRLERGPLQLLKERGRLTEDTFTSLREELSGEATAPRVPGPKRPTP